MPRFDKNFEFGSKGDTLLRLRAKVTKSAIPDFLVFTLQEWRNEPQAVLDEIQALGDGGPVIVRSSSRWEDSLGRAHAGAFTSVPGVDARDRGKVAAAVDEVIASYGRHDPKDADHPEHQFIAQVMIADGVAMSGVVFTQDLNSGAPYYVINYDDVTGGTDSVTSGDQYSSRTIYILRNAWERVSSPRFLQLIEAVQEIEAIVEDTCLDIEFALGRNGVLHLLQVRRITSTPNWNRGISLRIRDALTRVHELLEDRYGRAPETGELEQTVLGVMPDWNPAEMIGTAPRPLAFSLYQTLVTDRSWRVARARMGYRSRRGSPLMLSLAGRPYIDVRESFHSFLPAELPLPLGDKLVAAWLERLRGHHELLDKVEFDVAVTCYTPDFDQRVDTQVPGGLTAAEREAFRESLRRLTNRLVRGEAARMADQRGQLEGLAVRRAEAVAACRTPDLITVRYLLEEAAEFGVIPFAVLARHAFVAMSFLRAFERLGILDAETVLRFQRGIPTVASEFNADARRLAAGRLPEAEFLARYGYLRPGTYDILAPRYDTRPEFWSSLPVSDGHAEPSPVEFTAAQRKDMAAALAAHGLEVGVDRLLDYIRAAIQGREYGKFVFTHNVSDALEIMAAWAERHGISRDELSMVPVQDVLACGTACHGRSIEDHLRTLADRGAAEHQVTSAIRLPFGITRFSDLVIAPLSVNAPNFITRATVGAPLVHTGQEMVEPADIDGKIVVIESADPGYDWVFTRPLAGLITKYGGANSHMAIRCAEFGLPAAIGCGEQIYERLMQARQARLICAEGRILIED